MKTKKSYTMKFLTLGLAIIFILTSCSTSKTLKGGAIGTGVGGVIGGLIGSRSDNTAKGAILGAVIGGTAGALIGNYMDKQAEELRKDLEGAKIERVGEGIKITFDSGILFDFNSYALRSNVKENLINLSRVLNKYEDTEILIEGHTDNKGTDEYNQKLSEERASSVSQFLISKNVKSARITTKGYGESQPIADNDTEAGRQANRRVEIAIYANKKLKRAAKRGDI